ncbi:Amidohydrolase 3 [Thermovirga lienii DSM 17291]|uniref:Amidohydrolase 3 n=1 Tax=Thermovirga lienii (strain ATCC BAA-1197 / DSM 17291 / Cas60314) TaxID=580340 RepID=G7V739_THELD|nr:amidohydrolase [Thermovirga lienii]AER66073.1 Amidohydrolase 3 [Thermovirga lienii DSM 17291]
MSKSMLIYNGDIWTGEGKAKKADAVLFSSSHIEAVGTYDEVKNHPLASEALKLDVEGRTVIPGMYDSHLHLTALSRQLEALDLSKAKSKEELYDMLRKKASQTSPTEWIYGVRFDNSSWEDDSLPTLKELDELGLPNPVILERVCTHLHVVNSRALMEANFTVSATTKGALFDSSGNFTGALVEGAAEPMVQIMGKSLYDKKNEPKRILRTCQLLASFGLTAINPCSAASYGLKENIDALLELKEKNTLPLRVRLYSDEPHEAMKFLPQNDKWLSYGGRKFFLDGSLGARTAALTFPYVDAPFTQGILNYSKEEIKHLIVDCHKKGVQTQTHAIGDGALDQLIEAIEAAMELKDQPGGVKHRAVHLQICRPDQMNKLAKLGVVGDVQPVFVPSDIKITENRIGKERLSWAYAWKSMANAGMLLTASSDAPVEPPNPMRGIWSAVERTDDQGLPKGGWLPEEKLTLDEALRMYTVNPSKASGLEDKIGKIKAKMYPDLVVLDSRISVLDPDKLKDVKVLLTFVGGRLSFGKLDGWERIPY